MGEFSAHLIAGTFVSRKRFVSSDVAANSWPPSGAERPGTMAAVLGLDEALLDEICSGVSSGTVVPANINAPGQIVISGDRRGRVGCVRTGRRGRRSARRTTQRERCLPFAPHGGRRGWSPQRADGNSDVRSGVPGRRNATADLVTDASSARETLLLQLTSRYVGSRACRMRDEEPDEWIEVGPGGVLSGLLRRLDRGLRARALGDPESIDTFMDER